MTFNPKKHTRNTFKKMTIELVSLDTDKFNCDDLIEVLSNVTFSLININLTTSKANIGFKGNGFAPIGFVNKFYTNEEGMYVFDVAVLNKYVPAIDELTKDSELGITARVFTNKEDKITKIIGLDLTPVVK